MATCHPEAPSHLFSLNDFFSIHSSHLLILQIFIEHLSHKDTILLKRSVPSQSFYFSDMER